MPLKYVKKRDGNTVKFDRTKIKNAVLKAASAVDLENDAIGEEITQEVVSYLNIFFEQEGIPEVEQIQDLVEKVLIEKGYAEVAKAYILYRQQHNKIRDTKKLFNDAVDAMNDYLELDDWKVKENSNMGYSLQGLNNFISSEVTAQYWLQEIYPEEAGEKHTNGDLHIHDLGNLSVYCCGWDLEDFLRTGFRGVPTKIESNPPKHLKTALGQIINFFFTLQGEAAGAMAFSNFDTLLAPFIAYDDLDYKEVKQAMQGFLFNMNVPTRVGFQTPFTNITMDLTVPKHFEDQPVIIGGEMKERTYGEFQEEMDMFNRAFAEVMMSGDAKGRVFSFPIPTYNITSDFDWENPKLDPIWEMTAKYGIPYFSNFVNSDMDPEDARSMCLYPEETILIKENNNIKKYTIEESFKEYKGKQIDNEWFETKNEVKALSLNPNNGKLEWANINKFLKTTDNKLIKITAKDGKSMRVSADHLVAVYSEKGITTKKAHDIELADSILVSKDAGEILNKRSNIPIEEIESLINSNYAVTEIKNIEKEDLNYQQDFYDIELDKNHYFVHSDGNITHNCCRLRLDNRELKKRGGGLFGANPMTGSIGVVTLNMPRIGYLSDSKEEYMERVYELMDLAKNSLEQKRTILENLTEQGLYPYAKFYLRNIKKRFDEYWKNHFNTIGINGMNESLINFMGKDITDEKAYNFTLEVMEKMKSKMQEFQEETDNLYNLEATPAESTSYRLARIDKQKFGDDIIAANEDRVEENDAEPYYTNSTHLPVGYTEDIFDALELQDELQAEYTGGCIEKGNKVATDKGLLKIEDIVKNYEKLKPIKAISYNQDKNQAEWDLIEDAMSIDVSENDKIRVKAEKGLDITTSDWHPFFVVEKRHVEDDCPVCGEEISSFATHMNQYKVREKRADELEAGDYILQNDTNLYSENKSDLDNDLMWFLGYFISADKIFEDDITIIDENMERINSTAELINNEFSCDIEFVGEIKSSGKNYKLTLSDETVKSFLSRYNINLKDKVNKDSISEKVKDQITQDNVYSFLSGLLEIESSDNEVIEYLTKSEKLADDILEVCSKAGIVVYKTIKNNTDTQKVFKINFDEKILVQLDLDNSKEPKPRKKQQFAVTKVIETNKVSVEDNQFYDLTTEKHHNYLAGKNTLVFIHNTVFHGFLGE
ncbi:MAG: ribonucleoside triphosphate reductase, partial [Halanaerobiales bacterium]|nr:ribonucleoside triphosphate reductase [Halanaerobiales bacterium]